MAIAVSSIVLASNSGAPSIPNAIGPIQGVVASGAGAGPFSVQWSNGRLDTNVPQAALDLLVNGDTSVANTLVGRHVMSGKPTGQTNYGLCVCLAVYKRDPGGAGGGGVVQFALLQNVTTLAFFEVIATDAVVVA